MKLNKKRKGFTLVELIVVVVILGILMGIGALKYADVKRSSNLRVLQANNRTLVSALQLQMATNGGTLPATLNTKAELLKLAEGIVDGTPVGADYDFDGTNLTTKVTSPGDDYPKDGSANPTSISITTNIKDGTVTYVPATAGYFTSK